MNGIDVIRTALEQSRIMSLSLIEDMKDALTVQPTPEGGNHTYWVFGHNIASEHHLVHRFILGDDQSLDWAKPFAGGTAPGPDTSGYPSFDTLRSEFVRVREETLAALDGMTEADLDEPSHAPKEYEALFGTKARCFLEIALHSVFHAGQVADCRRAAGRKPVFA